MNEAAMLANLAMEKLGYIVIGVTPDDVHDTGSGTCICFDGIAKPRCPQHGWDEKFYGIQGIDLSRWGNECSRGLRYIETGAPVRSGKAGQSDREKRDRYARSVPGESIGV